MIEISEDGHSDPLDIVETSSSYPSLYYQHTYEKRSLLWYSVEDPGVPYDSFDSVITTAEEYNDVKFGSRVPMIQLCVFPDACAHQSIVEVTTNSNEFESPSASRRNLSPGNVESNLEMETELGDKQSKKRIDALGKRNTLVLSDDSDWWSAATVQVALNGIDFYDVDSALMIYDESQMYFDPSVLTPIIGPNSGDTEITFTLPSSFPFANPSTYYRSMNDENYEVTPIDKPIIWFRKLNSGGNGFDDFQEFSIGEIDSESPSDIMYTYSLPLLQGTYSVFLSINGIDFWPPNLPNETCSLTSPLTSRVLSGNCVESISDCSGKYDLNSFQKSDDDIECAVCCITDTQFYVYNEFDISLVDGSLEFDGFASGKNSSGSGKKFVDVAIDVGDTSFIDPAQVCCFFLSPRTDDEFASLIHSGDAYVDRMLALPPIDDINNPTFPRQLAGETTVCGSSVAFVTSSTTMTCSAPALPVWQSTDDAWKMRVTVNAQNHHGIQNDNAGWDDLDGISYYSLPCPEGYFAATYIDTCQPCVPGTNDDRTDLIYDELTECKQCASGKYQELEAQRGCVNCPRASYESDSNFFSTSMDIDGNFITGQIYRESCMCKEGYYRDSRIADCDSDMECCNSCPTPGGKCDGGVSIKPPESSIISNDAPQKATYYDYASGNFSEYYHQNPYAMEGYWRLPNAYDDEYGECVPAPKKANPGACEGGWCESRSTYQCQNVCGKGYDSEVFQHLLCFSSLSSFYQLNLLMCCQVLYIALFLCKFVLELHVLGMRS